MARIKAPSKDREFILSLHDEVFTALEEWGLGVIELPFSQDEPHPGDIIRIKSGIDSVRVRALSDQLAGDEPGKLYIVSLIKQYDE